MGELDGIDDGVFLHLAGAGFDHDDAVGAAAHHQAEQAFAHFFVSRVDDELAVFQADTHGADRAAEGDVGEGQRSRGRIDGGDVGIVLVVGREAESDHLGFAAEAVREQGPHGTVNLAAGQNFTLAGAAFALDEAAGDASAGVGVFAVIDGEGKEIDSLARFLVGGGGAEDDVVGKAYDHGAMRLLGQFAGFK